LLVESGELIEIKCRPTAKVPERLKEAFKILSQKVMYASSENQARMAFKELNLLCKAMLKEPFTV
jgi:hypothetical protein